MTAPTKPVADLPLVDVIVSLFQDYGPLSAHDVTRHLIDLGRLPDMWTVIDVADYMKEWFS